ncbi:MAG TPA: trigger factor [Thermoanaerobaculia bacterium]|jgi:trigger factor|nr:trigger factor [Thermoanaerobaculia bacterium]
MSVVLSVQDVGPCRKQLTIEIPAPAVEAETARVLREYGAKAKIPGFRQGKVPGGVVRRHFGKEIDQEVIERLVPRYWRQAQAEAELEPLMSPDVDSVDPAQPGEPMKFTATVEVRPKIALGSLTGFELPDPPTEPAPIEVEEALDDLRKRVAEWRDVSRPAVRGDLAVGKIFERFPAEDRESEGNPFEVEIGDPRVWEELTLAATGLSAGQEGRFERREAAPAPGESAAEGAESQLRHFRIVVDAVRERDLPALDDAFAQKMSASFTDVAALQEALSARIRSEKTQNRKDQRERTLLDQLRERHPTELPAGVVRRETETLLRDYAENMARSGVDVEKAEIDWHRLGHDMQPLAEKRVHARLVLDAVADAEKIAVTEAEFETALATLARAQGASTPALRKALDADGRLQALRQQLRRDKTIRHLLGEEPAAGEKQST